MLLSILDISMCFAAATRRHIAGRASLLLVASIAISAASTRANPTVPSKSQSTSNNITLIKIDGTSITGQWIGSTDGSSVAIRASGRDMTLRLDGVHRIVFTDASNGEEAMDEAWFRRPAGEGLVPAIVHLADGGRLYCGLQEESDQNDAVAIRSSLGDEWSLSFDAIAAIQLAPDAVSRRSATLFRKALGARRAGEDVLITRVLTGPKSVRGRLETVGSQIGAFAFGGRSRSFKTEQMFAIVLATGVRDLPTGAFPVMVTLKGGSRFRAEIIRADVETVELVTSFDVRATIPTSAIASMRVLSARVVYVSDLTPSDEQVEGRLHLPWPMRTDRNVSGGSMSMAGRTFEHGLGMHSRSSVVYKLAGDYESFAATIGLDDAVRPRGSVVFRMLGDDRVLFDSGLVTGRDAPRDIIVDVSSVESVTLVVDFGDRLDLSDHADWGDARLLKPASETADPQH